MMDENPDADMEVFIAVLGGNAARLFKRANLQEKVEARSQSLIKT